MAIDYGGNFYFVTESQETYEAALVKGQLTGDSLAFVSETSLGEAGRPDWVRIAGVLSGKQRPAVGR